MNKQFLLLLVLPSVCYAAVQCYVGQKLFSYESNMAVCARFIPYGCAVQCEWRNNCSQHTSYTTFRGRRTFVSGLLINSKSLMVLCCASLSTRLENDASGKEKCVWRDEESLSVLGPSIRTNPVLAPNHYIRDIRMKRDGEARVDLALEVCQYQTELQHCNVQNMTEAEKRRFNILQLKLQRSSPNSQVQKTDESDKNQQPASEAKRDDLVCNVAATSACGKDVQTQIHTCCKDRAACDRSCLKGIEQNLQLELVHHRKGCTSTEIRQTLDCLGRKVNNLLQ